PVVVGGIWRERFTSGEQFWDCVSEVIVEGAPAPCLPNILPETDEDITRHLARTHSSRHVMHDPSADQFGLSLGPIKIVQGGAGYGCHCSPPSSRRGNYCS